MKLALFVKARAISRATLLCGASFILGAAGCGQNKPAAQTVPGSEAPAAASAPAATGPVDVCAIVTPADVATILGPLPAQPPSKTESVGFGIDQCMYVGPKRSGEGAQTIFSQLSVQAGAGKDAADLLQNDADKRKAGVNLAGVGDSAKRNTDGSFIWAQKGPYYCTAQINNGRPPALTADSAAAQLSGLCMKLFSKLK